MKAFLSIIVAWCGSVIATAAELSASDYAQLTQECWARRGTDPKIRSRADTPDYQADLAAALASSNDVEDQLARALLGQSLDSAVVDEAVHRGLELDPDNPLLLEFATGQCAVSPEFSWCGSGIADRWVAADPGNLNAHLAALEAAWQADRVDEAQSILVAAAEAATHTTPIGVFGAAVANAIHAHPLDAGLSQDEAAITGMGFEAALPMVNRNTLLELCTSALSDSVLAACLQIGRMLTASEERLIDHILGMMMMEQMHEAIPNLVTEAELAEGQRRKAEIDRLQWKSQYLMCEHDIGFAEWLKHVLRYGEIAGMARMVDSLEASRDGGAGAVRDAYTADDEASIGSVGDASRARNRGGHPPGEKGDSGAPPSMTTTVGAIVALVLAALLIGIWLIRRG